METSGNQTNTVDPRTPDAARARVNAAKELIHEARELLNRAATTICDVRGLANEWTAMGKVADQCRSLAGELRASAFQAAERKVLDLDRDTLNDEDLRLLNIPPPATDPFYTKGGDEHAERARRAAFKQDPAKAFTEALLATQMWAIAAGPGWSTETGHKKDLEKLEWTFSARITKQHGPAREVP